MFIWSIQSVFYFSFGRKTYKHVLSAVTLLLKQPVWKPNLTLQLLQSYHFLVYLIVLEKDDRAPPATQALHFIHWTVFKVKEEQIRRNKALTVSERKHRKLQCLFVWLSKKEHTNPIGNGGSLWLCESLHVRVLMFHAWVNECWWNDLLNTLKVAHSLCFLSNFVLCRYAVKAVYSAKYMTVRSTAGGCFS